MNLFDSLLRPTLTGETISYHPHAKSLNLYDTADSVHGGSSITVNITHI